MWSTHKRATAIERPCVHTQAVQARALSLPVEQTNYDAFSINRRNRRHACVDRSAGDVQRISSVLRLPSLRYVDFCKHLHARYDLRMQALVEESYFVKPAVDALTHPAAVSVWLNVNVRGARPNGTFVYFVQNANGRRRCIDFEPAIMGDAVRDCQLFANELSRNGNRLDAHSREQPNPVHGRRLAVGYRNQQLRAVYPVRQHVVTERKTRGNVAKRLRIRIKWCTLRGQAESKRMRKSHAPDLFSSQNTRSRAPPLPDWYGISYAIKLPVLQEVDRSRERSCRSSVFIGHSLFLAASAPSRGRSRGIHFHSPALLRARMERDGDLVSGVRRARDLSRSRACPRA